MRVSPIVLLALALALSAVAITESTRVTLLRASTTVGTFAGWEACNPEAKRLANASTGTSGTVTHTCQTERWRVVATYSAAPPPPPPPPPPPGSGKGIFGSYLPPSPSDPVDAAALRVVDATLATPPDITQKEPWLFDRASTFYVWYLRTGDVRYRVEALRLVPIYYANIDATGLFMAAQASWYGDTKYSYVDPALWYEQETGDRQFRPKARAIWRFHVQYNPKTYSSTQNAWTERHHNYALRASLAYWKLTGEAAALQDARDYAETVFSMSAASGAPLHGDGQHEGGDNTPGVQITSPWMGALLVETMAAYGRETGDARVNPWIARYADFVLRECLMDFATNNYTPTRITSGSWNGEYWPAYLCGPNRYQWSDDGGWSDYQHSFDVAGLIAHGVAAKKALGQDATALRTAYDRLRATGPVAFAARPIPSPPRKLNWWFGTTYDNSQLVQ